MTQAREVDHIIPKSAGGADALANLQALCRSCHSEKTMRESVGVGAGSFDLARFYPRDLKASRLPLTIVCGPPAAGKTSYVAALKNSRDVVIDLDAIAGGRVRGNLGALLEKRNRLLRALHTARPDGSRRAWFIVGAPSSGERERWASQLEATEVVVLKPMRAVCLRRIDEDPERTDLVRLNLRRAVGSWFARYAPRAADTLLEGTRLVGHHG